MGATNIRKLVSAMPDREKVIKGLSRLFDNSGCLAIYDSECDVCPYKTVNGCVDQIIKDALELLKEDEKRIADYQRWHENQKNTIKEYKSSLWKDDEEAR